MTTRSSLSSPNKMRVMEVRVWDMGNEVLVDDKCVSKGQGQFEDLNGDG